MITGLSGSTLLILGFVLGCAFGSVLLMVLAFSKDSEREGKLEMLSTWEKEKIEELVRGMSDEELAMAYVIADDEISSRLNAQNPNRERVVNRAKSIDFKMTEIPKEQ